MVVIPILSVKNYFFFIKKIIPWENDSLDIRPWRVNLPGVSDPGEIDSMGLRGD